VLCIDYEGQGAVRLEKIQDMGTSSFYPMQLKSGQDLVNLDTLDLFAQVWEDFSSGTRPAIISRKFHLALAHGICNWAMQARKITSINTIGLSGGVMQNMTLSSRLEALLEGKGFQVLVHHRLPPNDACVSLGQAFFGQCLLKS
ncbi:MAG: hydrogenase maturation protein HypF, partial [Desulfonatronovibrionaceae bacterium]